VRSHTVKHTALLGRKVRSPATRWNQNNDKALRRISVSGHQQQLYTERFIYPISGRLHYLLFDGAEILLMQGRSAVCPVCAHTDDENTTTHVRHCAQIVSKIINTMELSLEVKALGLVSPLADQALNTCQGANVSRDAESYEEWIHDQ
jgi:hypothetical protein